MCSRIKDSIGAILLSLTGIMRSLPLNHAKHYDFLFLSQTGCPCIEPCQLQSFGYFYNASEQAAAILRRIANSVR